MHDQLETIILALTMIGEFAIAAVIYLEVQTTRLDKFLEAVLDQKSSEARRRIFTQYCGINAQSNDRTQQFTQLLRSNEVLRQDCDSQLSLLSRIGRALPLLPHYRRNAVRWFPHSAAFLCAMLSLYVEQRRRTRTPRWADEAENFVRLCVQELRTSKRPTILEDPDRQRAHDFILDLDTLQFTPYKRAQSSHQ
jgi:hypothetical protein